MEVSALYYRPAPYVSAFALSLHMSDFQRSLSSSVYPCRASDPFKTHCGQGANGVDNFEV